MQLVTDFLEMLSQAPQFVWEAVANFASILAAGLIIAFVTSYIFRKKDERTRVAGVILEKRIEAQQEILQFMESNTQKFEMPQPQASNLRELMHAHDFVLPYEPHIQYAEFFISIESFRIFFHDLEKILEKNKLWLGLEVRRHLQFMNAYFASINAILVQFNRVPLPIAVKLEKADIDEMSATVLFVLGAALDEEFNHLVMDLEVLMVDSIYKLDLKRPKTSFFSKRAAGREVKKIEKFLYKKSLLGIYLRYSIVPLIINLVQAHKQIEITVEDAIEYFENFSTTHNEDKPRSFL